MAGAESGIPEGGKTAPDGPTRTPERPVEPTGIPLLQKMELVPEAPDTEEELTGMLDKAEGPKEIPDGPIAIPDDPTGIPELPIWIPEVPNERPLEELLTGMFEELITAPE